MQVFGHEIKVAQTVDRQCSRSATDHLKLVHEARADRQRLQKNVDESYVLCTHCVTAFSLKI
jgi:hypothetical protein